jgi:uncharacterized coiled-coil protein SlyX
VHLLGVPPDLTNYPPAERIEPGSSSTERIARLETEVTMLSMTIQTLSSRIDRLEARLESQAEASGSINDSSVR